MISAFWGRDGEGDLRLPPSSAIRPFVVVIAQPTKERMGMNEALPLA